MINRRNFRSIISHKKKRENKVRSNNAVKCTQPSGWLRVGFYDEIKAVAGMKASKRCKILCSEG